MCIQLNTDAYSKLYKFTGKEKTLRNLFRTWVRTTTHNSLRLGMMQRPDSGLCVKGLFGYLIK